MAHKILAIIALLALLLTTIPVAPVYASDIVDPIILEDAARPEELTPIKRMEPIQAPDRVAQGSISWRSAQGFTIIQPEIMVPQMFQTPILEGIQRGTSIRQQALSNGSASPDITQCIVTTSNDSGSGSLRQCLLTATDGTVISFHPQVFPPSAPMTISLLSDLPWLTKAIAIDGSNAGVILNGSASTASYGLVISDTSFAVINGIQITNFPLGGIVINNALNSGIFSNLISGNSVGIWLIGTGTSNNQIAANYIWGNSSAGIILMSGANKNIIGGDLAGAGNLISGNGVGIQVQNTGTVENQIQANYIGVDQQGALPFANGNGIIITDGASQNIIGGDTVGTGNLISGNNQAGVRLIGAKTTQNKLMGNYIGTDIHGTTSLSNPIGIFISLGASGNIIGGDTPGTRNLISGNGDMGIQLVDVHTAGNQVLGNFIGTDVTGKVSLGNSNYGVVMMIGASANVIGGITSGSRNLISGNGTVGVVLQNSNTISNQVLGNIIGADVDGVAELKNGQYGIALIGGASENTIGGDLPGSGNLISGNGTGGVFLQDPTTKNNKILGNIIGADIHGTKALKNGEFGVAIAESSENVIGGDTLGTRNLISGNGVDGVRVLGTNAIANKVLGNYIGTNLTGTAAIPNEQFGVTIGIAATNNIIGGETPSARNLISGNEGEGIALNGQGTKANIVLGNYIGTDVTGNNALGNQSNGVVIYGQASENIIGGETSGARNLISGNESFGVVLYDDGTMRNKVLGNYIGTNVSGTLSISNTRGGINITIQASENSIGGAKDGERNLISGNGWNGIAIHGTGTTKNQVLGNYIGTTSMGTTTLGNTQAGVIIAGGASANVVGGNNASNRNVISGNGIYGVVVRDSGTIGNQVQGNYIGTDVSGTMGLGSNALGVLILNGASNNFIGGTTPGMRNLISGNGYAGIGLRDVRTANNQIQGNYIGSDSSGTVLVGNQTFGIIIGLGVSNNTVGGSTPGTGNLISGNDKSGIELQDAGTVNNKILDNAIGVDATGKKPLANGSYGVHLSNGAGPNTVGPNNIIGYNGGHGIAIEGAATIKNTITRNIIYSNTLASIKWISDVVPIDLQSPLTLTAYSTTTLTLSGHACDTCSIEVFAHPQPKAEGIEYLGSTTSNANGDFILTLNASPSFQYLSITATNAEGTTSEFSASINLANPPHSDALRIYLPMIIR